LDHISRTWVIHGDVDTAVNYEKKSTAFVEKTKKLGGADARLEIRPGRMHGLDIACKESEDA